MVPRGRASYICRSMSRVMLVPTLHTVLPTELGLVGLVGARGVDSGSIKTPTLLAKREETLEEEGQYMVNHGIPYSPAACRVGWRWCLSRYH